MNSADFFPLAHDSRREKNPPPYAALLARGEQTRAVVLELMERLSRLEASCQELVADLPQDQADSHNALFERLEKWREQQRRHELEQDDLLREMQRELSELSQSLRATTTESSKPASKPAAASHTPGSITVVGGSSSWEAAKRRMLAELDGEDPGVENAPANLVAADEGWQRLLEQKEAEIAELRERLASHGRISETVELDELVQEERQKLRRLQAEWEEKLRQSEVEISIERAKLARERTQLEEKLRRMPSAADADGATGDKPPASDKGAEKSTRGRWLARLGLLDESQ